MKTNKKNAKGQFVPKIPLPAQFVELPVLGEEGEPVREYHGGSQVVEQIRRRKGSRVAIVRQDAVGQVR